MNTEPHQVATDPQSKPTDWGCESTCKLLSSTPTITIYYMCVKTVQKALVASLTLVCTLSYATLRLKSNIYKMFIPIQSILVYPVTTLHTDLVLIELYVWENKGMMTSYVCWHYEVNQ